MTDGAPVLYHDRSRASAALIGLYGLVATGAIAQLAVGASIPALVTLALFTVLFITTSVLRVTVTERNVFVRLVLFGPTIPLSAIEWVETFRYTFWDYGGWGVRTKIGKATMYNVPGDKGHAVRIRWTDTDGRQRTTCVGSRRADTLAAELERARGSVLALETGDA